MKKAIKAAESDYPYSDFESYIDMLNDYLYYAKCEASGTDPDNMTIKFIDAEFHGYTPIVTSVEASVDSDGEQYRMYFEPVVKFPEIRIGDLDYFDSANSIIKRWAEYVGKMQAELDSTPYTRDI